MKTRTMIRAHTRRVLAGGALLLAATLLVSGATVADEGDGQTIDPATQAAWLYDHFCCEHAAEMPSEAIVDPATQAAWLYDHFCCEHAAEMPSEAIVDPATQAAWLYDHFCCEHAAEMGAA
jgi:hypothetical protein